MREKELMFRSFSEISIKYIRIFSSLFHKFVDMYRHEGMIGLMQYIWLIFSLPAMDILSHHRFKAGRKTVLIVTHEASQSSSKVFSYNIAKVLSGRYNIVVLLMGVGPISEFFCKLEATVIHSFRIGQNPGQAGIVVGQLCKCLDFKFALVNSIESRLMLPFLCGHFVPTISLIHESAADTHQRNVFQEAIFWSGEVVFSAKSTLKNVLAEFTTPFDSKARIHLQKKYPQPLKKCTDGNLQMARAIMAKAVIRRLIRPDDLSNDTVIVLGAGFVHLRENVDRFIKCAIQVARTQGADRCRFIWIEQGYNDKIDLTFHSYLTDQIHRAGFDENLCTIFSEIVDIQTVYKEADLLLLLSRSDPWPNVAIDAMDYGLPVICFNKTIGISDFLEERNLHDYCVAEFPDTDSLAEKVITLAGSRELRERIGARCREASKSFFNIHRYAARLDAIAQKVYDQTRQEEIDVQTILSSGLFRRDFFACPPSSPSHEPVSFHPPPLPHDPTIGMEVCSYVRAWASGIGRRKSFPGFHPGIYAEQHGLEINGADPLADFLRAGRPDGAWNYPVIVEGNTGVSDLPGNERIALHLHVYYPELFEEISNRLSHNRIRPDLFISVTNEEVRDFVANALKGYEGRIIDIRIVPNRGRDIGPFLTAFGLEMINHYDFVGHFHTKKSACVKDDGYGESWYLFLLENLIGGETRSMADRILAAMKRDTSIGMAIADDPNVFGWSANKYIAETIADRLGLRNLPEYFNFPVGTMFWARASALAPLINLKFGWNDYPEEPLLYDGTLLHAMERLLPITLALNSLCIAATNVAGLTR